MTSLGSNRSGRDDNREDEDELVSCLFCIASKSAVGEVDRVGEVCVLDSDTELPRETSLGSIVRFVVFDLSIDPGESAVESVVGV